MVFAQCIFFWSTFPQFEGPGVLVFSLVRILIIVHAEHFLTKSWLFIGRGNALECAQENKFSPYRVAIY